MCGIAGAAGLPESQAAVARMLAALRHRGPDDQGIENVEQDSLGVCLGSTRLAILDLSAAGHMPMADAETGNTIVFNGEVFNFRELRGQLEAAGDRFVSGTDTEVVLKGYRRWGGEVVRKLRGMFAFAIWDARRRELLLARDRLGIKPLYYCVPSGGGFLFASEVRALLASGPVERRLDPAGVELFLFNGFLISPTTMVRGVRSLLPGHCLRVAGDGRILEQSRYWQIPEANRAGGSQTDATEELRARLEEAVRLRLVSDVPLGVFLSGGLDSSTIAAVAARQRADIRTFSVGFEEAECDESEYSAAVARRLQSSHTAVRLRSRDFVGWLPDALEAMDQPTFDGVNTYYISRAVRESGITVALSGLGGDELFGGYPFFRSIPRLERIAAATARWPSKLLEVVGRPCRRHPWGVAAPWKLWQLWDSAGERGGRMPRLAAAYQTVQMLFPSWTARDLLAEDFPYSARRNTFGMPDEFAALLADEVCEGSMPDSISRLALRLFMGERCLRDTDSMSMGVSLEIRVPFTDHLLVEAAFGVAGRVRCQGSPNKTFETGLVRPFLGDEHPVRRKQGFILPFEKWLRERTLLNNFQAMFEDRSVAAAAGFRTDALRGLLGAFRDGGAYVPWSRVWSIYVLLGWCARHRVAL